VSRRTAAIPERGTSKATHEVWFKASLAPLGYSTFFVAPVTYQQRVSVPTDPMPKADVLMTNQRMRAVFDGQTGLLKQVYNLDSSVKANIR